MTIVVKLVGKRVEYIEEIRADIKVCTKLGDSSVMQIFTEFREVHASDKVSYEIVCRWRKGFQTCNESVKDAANSGQPVNITGKGNVSKVWEIIDSVDRCTIFDIAKAFGISLSLVDFI